MRNRLFGNLKRAVADIVDDWIAAPTFANWFMPADTPGKQAALMGFDLHDESGRTIGRFEGYVYLFDGTTPEQFVSTIRDAD